MGKDNPTLVSDLWVSERPCKNKGLSLLRSLLSSPLFVLMPQKTDFFKHRVNVFVQDLRTRFRQHLSRAAAVAQGRGVPEPSSAACEASRWVKSDGAAPRFYSKLARISQSSLILIHFSQMLRVFMTRTGAGSCIVLGQRFSQQIHIRCGGQHQSIMARKRIERNFQIFP